MCVGSGTPGAAAEFKRRIAFEGALYVDPKRVLYKALLVHKGLGRVLKGVPTNSAVAFDYRCALLASCARAPHACPESALRTARRWARSCTWARASCSLRATASRSPTAPPISAHSYAALAAAGAVCVTSCVAEHQHAHGADLALLSRAPRTHVVDAL